MKCSVKKSHDFALHKQKLKERSNLQPLVQLGKLAKEAEDVQELKKCYDGFLSAATATANSAYEFSESLVEMGNFLLKRATLNDDEESSKVFAMLGELQFELQNLVDKYRSHIVQTITIPSESLLNEIKKVEEMKQRCDEKRNVCECLFAEKRKMGAKEENVLSLQLKTAQDDYKMEEVLFVFRLKSLKQGQMRSVLTQAARHHSAQLNLFRKGLKSLEGVEPCLKLVTEKQHIDYQFGLGYGFIDDDDSGYGVSDDGELSFDYGQNDIGHNVGSTSWNPTEENQAKIQGDQPVLSTMPKCGSQSAIPLTDEDFNLTEKIRDMGPSSTRKLDIRTTPDTNVTVISGSSNTLSGVTLESASGHAHRCHYSPMHTKLTLERENLSSYLGYRKRSTLRSYSVNVRLSPALYEPGDAAPDTKNITRHAFSGPLTSGASMYKPDSPVSRSTASRDLRQIFSTLLSRNRLDQSPPQKVSPSASPPLMKSRKASKPHILRRPSVRRH